MATKKSNMNTLIKNKKAIMKFGCAVHDELIGASHMIIDETVNTVTKSQKIAGKIIKNGEPIVAKQVEITIDTISEVKNQAIKGGKRALKLLGLTKEFNALTKNISKRVDAIPSADDLIDNAKDYVATAKSDVEKTITKASKSIKKVAATAEKKIDSATAELTKTTKATSKKATPKSATKRTAKKVVKTVAKTKAIAKKATPAKASAKKVVTKKVTPAKAKAATKKVTSVKVPTKIATPIKKANKTVAKPVSDLTKINGIGPSLANIMNQNGIKNIEALKSATPDALKVVTQKAGNRYASFDTNKWVEAAKAISK